MKQYQINRVYNVLNKLMNMELPIRDSYRVYSLSTKLKDYYEFEIDREKKLLAKYHSEQGQNGEIYFKTKEDGEGFQKELTELNNLDVDIDITPIEISFDSFGDQCLTPNDILYLDGFIKFI